MIVQPVVKQKNHDQQLVAWNRYCTGIFVNNDKIRTATEKVIHVVAFKPSTTAYSHYSFPSVVTKLHGRRHVNQ